MGNPWESGPTHQIKRVAHIAVGQVKIAKGILASIAGELGKIVIDVTTSHTLKHGWFIFAQSFWRRK